MGCTLDLTCSSSVYTSSLFRITNVLELCGNPLWYMKITSTKYSEFWNFESRSNKLRNMLLWLHSLFWIGAPCFGCNFLTWTSINLKLCKHALRLVMTMLPKFCNFWGPPSRLKKHHNPGQGSLDCIIHSGWPTCICTIRTPNCHGIVRVPSLIYGDCVRQIWHI